MGVSRAAVRSSIIIERLYATARASLFILHTWLDGCLHGLAATCIEYKIALSTMSNTNAAFVNINGTERAI